MRFIDIWTKQSRTDVIEPNKISGYYSRFREVSQDELERLRRDYQGKIDFFRKDI
jgi:hypothetical protein